MPLLVRQACRQGNSVVLALLLELTAVPIFPSAFMRDSSTFLPVSGISQELWNAGTKFKVFLLS